ncbi:DMT family transporter [Methylovirgula sp. 4M-Z18]|uniref:DMT family transporter n=1 Tax=Methylovirgula sp. 4M-Z18 TaxID=2293567 RepID=UPI000E2F4652|nr:DMT family transporter [Methylovirgula sp. 4M-Z18]RFB78130.1 DMT family transporter [Methylovirgula sp. 4M-Z18]
MSVLTLPKAGSARQRRIGLALVVLATIVWSTAGLFARVVELDSWTILFWRGIFGATTGLSYLLWQKGGETLPSFRRMGWPDMAFSLSAALAMLAFFAALKHTSVAHVSIIYATVPFVTALLAWAVVREAASAATMAASFIALAGVTLMLGWGAGEGHLSGDILSFLMTALMGVMIVIGRAYISAFIVERCVLAALFSSLLSLPFATPLAASSFDVTAIALFGAAHMGLGMIVFGYGAQMIPASESALLGALETPLAPFWVWAVFGDIPGIATIVGGTIVLCAVCGHVLWESR